MPFLAAGLQVYENTTTVRCRSCSSVMLCTCFMLLSSFTYCLCPPFGTSCFSMPTIRIRCLMSLLSGQPNWVREFITFIGCVGLLLGVICLRFLNCFGFRVRLIGVYSMLMLFKTTSVSATWEWPNSIHTCDPHHLHANASPCGNVLQVGVGRGLLRSSSSHASVRF